MIDSELFMNIYKMLLFLFWEIFLKWDTDLGGLLLRNMLWESVSVYNLEGGIFRWHNDYNTVVSQVGETEAVHPFNRKWGQLLERQDMIRMRPESK